MATTESFNGDIIRVKSVSYKWPKWYYARGLNLIRETGRVKLSVFEDRQGYINGKRMTIFTFYWRRIPSKKLDKYKILACRKNEIQIE